MKKQKVAEMPKQAVNAKMTKTANKAKIWRIVTIAIMALALLWHGLMVYGWYSGDTMTLFYGMPKVFSETIIESPDILFNATYYSMAFSGVMFLVVALALILYLTDRAEDYVAMNVVLGFGIVAVWAFPVIHVVADLAATAANVRETSGLDVFQLGIQGLPLLIVSIGLAVLMYAYNRISDSI